MGTVILIIAFITEVVLERLYARTNGGFELKVLASIIALACTNIN